ncbi:MAG: hypothetical protein JWO62_2915 [Acidimicrobiaceae bacterium]|nr:hypothetical protein [Acidimicrobiaceae bacterium]
MIHEVDEALEALVKREALDGAGAEVVFDAPTKDWASRRNSPTVDVYLYDVREDPHRRHVGSYNERDEEGVLRSRTDPPRYFRLSYLVTAWTQRPEDEHRLLSAMLAAFLRHKVFPSDVLSGTLGELGMPVLLEVAKPPPENRQISEVWSALGGELKASLDVMVTAPMSSAKVAVTAPPASGGTVVRVFGEPGQESERHAPAPTAGATADAAPADATPAKKRA